MKTDQYLVEDRSRLEANASVRSVLEISGGLPPDPAKAFRLDRQLLLTHRKNDYRRSIEKTESGYHQTLVMPERNFRGALKEKTGISQEDLSRLRVLHPASPSWGFSLSANGHRRETYSSDVRYLAYRKIRRIYDDGHKLLLRRDYPAASLLLGICLVHLTRYQYIHEDRPVPFMETMVRDLDRQPGVLSELLEGYPSHGEQEAAYDLIGSLLDEYAEAYPWYAWNWESKPLRFGKGFTFEGLIFKESRSLFWRLKDRIPPHPIPILPYFRHLGDHWPGLERLSDLKREIVRTLKNIPEVTGALLMGSKAHQDMPLSEMADSDIDLVVFVRGFYLRRFFLKIKKVLLDGIVLSQKVANLAVQAGADMAINGFSTGEIIYDKSNRFSPLADIARRQSPLGPKPPEEAEIRYALLRLRVLSELGMAFPGRASAGIRFFFLDNLFDVLYLMSRALGVWFIGEQRILTGLESKCPQAARDLVSLMNRFGQRPAESLDFLYRMGCGYLGIEDEASKAESRTRFSLGSVFDF